MVEFTDKFVTPVSAATVMLVRDSQNGVEVFMLQRHSAADFGGSYVFPGGIASTGDRANQLEKVCSGLSIHSANKALNVDSGGLAYWVTAIRECFEESGYLLAYRGDGNFVDPGDAEHAALYQDYRAKLNNNELDIVDICTNEMLSLACDKLRYVRYWTTPVGAKRRYATRFFLARVPPEQHGVHDGRETVNSCWIRPEDAMSPEMSRSMQLHMPTIDNLRLIAGFTSTDALLVYAAGIDPASIKNIMPTIEEVDGQIKVSAPGDAS